MTMNYDEYGVPVDDESRYDLSGMAGFADRSEDQVSDSPEADPFTQGRAATGAASNPYSARAQLLKSQAEGVSKDAIETLNRALANQRDTGATQGEGLTAALLAAVPAIGGAVIGSSMKTKVPAGTFGAKIDPVGAGSIGAMGLDAGLKAAGGYLTSLKPSKEENDTLLKLAEYKERQARNLLGEANQVETAGANQEQINQRQQNYLNLQRELAGNKTAARQTQNEVLSTAMNTLRQSNPGLFQKVIGDVNALTPEEKLQIPQELMPFVMSKTQQKEGNYFDNFSPAQQDSLRKSKFVVDKARSLSDDLAKAGYSWAKYQTMRGLSAADTEGIGLELKYLADSLARARSGAALNTEEVILYNAMVGGDKTVDPRRAAMLLRKLSDIEAQSVMALEPLMAAKDKQSFFANFAPSAPIALTATPQDKIAANNAKIAELKSLLQQSKGLPK